MAGSGDIGMDEFSKSKTLPVLKQPTVANEGHAGDNTHIQCIMMMALLAPSLRCHGSSKGRPFITTSLKVCRESNSGQG